MILVSILSSSTCTYTSRHNLQRIQLRLGMQLALSYKCIYMQCNHNPSIQANSYEFHHHVTGLYDVMLSVKTEYLYCMLHICVMIIWKVALKLVVTQTWNVVKLDRLLISDKMIWKNDPETWLSRSKHDVTCMRLHEVPLWKLKWVI